MDPDPDPGGHKHTDPTDPDSDPDPQHWFVAFSSANEGRMYTFFSSLLLFLLICSRLTQAYAS
jgi:hypothetical protein